MGSFGARDAIFPLTLRLEFIEPSTTIAHEPPLILSSHSAWVRSRAVARSCPRQVDLPLLLEKIPAYHGAVGLM
mgnify:CR=1 FL=1